LVLHQAVPPTFYNKIAPTITLTVSWPCLQRKASTLDWPEPWVRDPEQQGRIPESLLCRCSWQTSVLWWRIIKIA